MFFGILEQCFNHLKDLAKFTRSSHTHLRNLEMRQRALSELIAQDAVDQDELFAELDAIEMALIDEAMSLSEDMLWPDPVPQLTYPSFRKNSNDNKRFRVLESV